jgi:ribose 5-phosphate isomerase B
MPRPLVSESAVRAALDRGDLRLEHPPGAIVTALARDLARERGLTLVATEPLPAVPDEPPRTSAPNPPNVVALGCDHGGFALKADVVGWVEAAGMKVLDLGTDAATPSVDYPDFAYAVARTVAAGGARFGIAIDGAGLGSAMAAGKVPGIRAAPCWSVFTAYNARAHNDANVLTLGSRVLGVETARTVVETFLATPFEGGRHARRVDKLSDIERRFAR